MLRSTSTANLLRCIWYCDPSFCQHMSSADIALLERALSTAVSSCPGPHANVAAAIAAIASRAAELIVSGKSEWNGLTASHTELPAELEDDVLLVLEGLFTDAMNAAISAGSDSIPVFVARFLSEHAARLDADSAAAATASAADLTRYIAPDSIWEALATGSVQLTRMSWLIELCHAGRVLPRRQEVPEEAVVSLSELKAMYGDGNKDGVLPIIAISFCWDTPEQPNSVDSRPIIPGDSCSSPREWHESDRPTAD